MKEKIRSWKEVQADIDVKREDLGEIFDQTKTEDGFDMSPDQVEKVREINNELTDLSKELETSKQMDDLYQDHYQQIKEAQRNEMDLPLNPAPKKERKEVAPLGKQVTESKRYKQRQGKDFVLELPDVDLKTLMSTSAGFAPESIRTGKVVPYAHRRPLVADLIPQTSTSQAAIKYMEETTFTNNAATRAEGGELGESALAYTEQSETIRSIGTILPVTDEQLEDVPQLRSLIDNRLVMMLMLEEEDQIITGDGSAPNLTGFLNKSGVGSQALGSDSIPDAIYKAMTTVRSSGFAEPTGLIMHPNDWQSIRLLTTADGIYIWGPPSEPGPERVWGLPAVITTAMTENTGLLGDFQLYSELFRKRGIVIESSKSHSDYFAKLKQAIRADERVALVIYRAAAFCRVTGI